MLANQIKLSELNSQINQVLTETFAHATFWVIADVTNHTYKREKNYHSLELVEKDANSNQIIARISAKAWGSGSLNISNFERTTGQLFTNNISALLNVSVDYHPVFGLQLNINDIDINFTLGALEQQRQFTLSRLLNENPSFISKVGSQYITRNSLLVFRPVIQRIAVISSVISAGAEDFKHTLNDSGYTFFVDEYNTVMQGENNADEFLKTLIQVYNSSIAYDAVVITRGGGAQTDFLIFDNYKIGKAIAKFPIPIITGIGHHKNETIADLMAHTQTKTPTKAAELIIAHNRQFEERMLSLQNSIIIKSQQIFSRNSHFLVQMNNQILNQAKDMLSEKRSALLNISSKVVSRPRVILYNRINDILNLKSNIITFNTKYLKNEKGYLNHYMSLIRLMAPDNILKKGFAMVKRNNVIINTADSIEVGDDIEVVFADKILSSKVNKKTDRNGSNLNI